MTTTEKESIQDAANRHYRYFAEEFGRLLRICYKAGEFQHYTWEEDIRIRILEDPLSLSVEAVYPYRDEVEWSLLLTWGGPAVRILVTTDLYGSVEHADYQFQDWFQPWTSATEQDDDLVMAYAQTFCYSRIDVKVDGLDVP